MFDLLIWANSYEDAQRIAQSQVGVLLAGPVYYEEIRDVEGDREGIRVEGLDPDWPIWAYPSRATMVAPASSFDHAVEIFDSLDGSFTTGDDGEEIHFEATDESPPKEGTLSATFGRYPQ
jgi:hypothetical protein